MLWRWLWERPYWQYSATVSVVSALAFVLLSRRANPRTVRLAASFATSRSRGRCVRGLPAPVHLARLHVAGASEHALTVVDIQRRVQLPSEYDLQQLVLPTHRSSKSSQHRLQRGPPAADDRVRALGALGPASGLSGGAQRHRDSTLACV